MMVMMMMMMVRRNDYDDEDDYDDDDTYDDADVITGLFTNIYMRQHLKRRYYRNAGAFRPTDLRHLLYLIVEAKSSDFIKNKENLRVEKPRFVETIRHVLIEA